MFELEIVLNTSYGGFSIDTEMALWLIEQRNWTLVPEKDYDYKAEYPLTTLINLKNFGDSVHSPNADKLEFRSHPDLIACVLAVKEAHENDKYPDAYYGHIHSLSIQKITVHVDIENYHDGKEKISCWIAEH